MRDTTTGNLLVMQLGEATATMNASLAGLITEALNHENIEEIYGCLNGLEGLLGESFIDLAEESQQNIRALLYTPGSILGCGCKTRGKFHSIQEVEKAVEVLKSNNIRFLFLIGGLIAAENALTIAHEAQKKDHEVQIIVIPASRTNEIPMMDHSPGYGSMAKHIAKKIKEAQLMHEHGHASAVVSIFEVLNQNSSWVTATGILGKRKNNENDAPHVVLIQENAFSSEEFIESIKKYIQKNKFCIVIANDNLVDENGNYICKENANSSIGKELSVLIQEQLNVSSNIISIEDLAAFDCSSISKTDSNEAFLAGKSAILNAINGKNLKMISLLRGETDNYSCETGVVSLEELVEVASKQFPENWLNQNGVSGISPAFFKYINPLIQGEVDVAYDHGLPRFTQLNMRRSVKQY